MRAPDLLGRRLLFFTGKGGVGKSTITAAMALLAADHGKRVLVIEVDAKGNIADRFEHSGVGFEPREVNPLVVEALAQVGLSLPSTTAQPSVFELFKAGRHFHYVIGVCDEEHGQKCPLFPGVTQRLYWSFPDPASFRGSPDEKLAEIRRLYFATTKQTIADDLVRKKRERDALRESNKP